MHPFYVIIQGTFMFERFDFVNAQITSESLAIFRVLKGMVVLESSSRLALTTANRTNKNFVALQVLLAFMAHLVTGGGKHLLTDRTYFAV